MNESKQSKRVAISTSATVRLALAMRARKTGVRDATMAAILVRQGLDPTIQSEAFQAELRAQKAQWTTAQRLEEMADDYEIEKLYRSANEETDEGSGGTVVPAD